MELSGYLALFRRRAALILLVVFLAVDAAALATWFGPRTYEASALLQVRTSSAGGTAYQDAEYTLERIPNYPPLIAGPQVLEAAAAATGLPPDQLGGRLSAVNPPGTSQLQVTAAAASRESAARAADSAAEALAEQIADQEPGPVRVRAELVVPAAVPTRPASPNLSLNLAGGALGGLAFGLLAALVLRDGPRVVRSAEDVQRLTGLRLLGQVPPVGGRHRGGPGAEETFREMTAALAHAYDGRLPRILLLCSAGPTAAGTWEHFVEGWARYLSAGGRRVAVFEAQAGLQAQPPAEDRPGWTDMLSSGASLPEILVSGPGNGVTRVPVGRVGNSLYPADLAVRAGPLLRAVAGRCDLLLVPTEPAAGPLNTPLLAPSVSAAVVLAGYGETTEEQMDVAVMELQTLGVRVPGVVMLDVPAARRSRVLHLSAAAEPKGDREQPGARDRSAPGDRAPTEVRRSAGEAQSVASGPAMGSMPQHPTPVSRLSRPPSGASAEPVPKPASTPASSRTAEAPGILSGPAVPAPVTDAGTGPFRSAREARG